MSVAAAFSAMMYQRRFSWHNTLEYTTIQ